MIKNSHFVIILSSSYFGYLLRKLIYRNKGLPSHYGFGEKIHETIPEKQDSP